MPYESLSVGCEGHLDPAGTGSFCNEGEADIIVQHILSLIYAVATVGPVMLFRGGMQLITAAGATTSS
ncbi:hypothetical protein NMG60_11031629 [Bertholletia excelsa]